MLEELQKLRKWRYSPYLWCRINVLVRGSLWIRNDQLYVPVRMGRGRETKKHHSNLKNCDSLQQQQHTKKSTEVTLPAILQPCGVPWMGFDLLFSERRYILKSLRERDISVRRHWSRVYAMIKLRLCLDCVHPSLSAHESTIYTTSLQCLLVTFPIMMIFQA